MTSPIARILMLVLAAVAVVTSLFYLWTGTVYLNSFSDEFTISMPVIGFELLSLLACGFAIAAAVRPRWAATGLAMACIGGTLASTVVLTFLELRANVSAGGLGQVVRAGVIARLAAGIGIAGLGGLSVLSRDARAFRDLLLAAVFLAPIAVVGGLVYRRGLGWLGLSADGPPSLIAVLSVSIGSLVLLICASAAAHWVIHAFARGIKPVLPGDAPAR